MSAALRHPTFAQACAGFVLLAEKTVVSKLTYRLATLLSLATSAFAYSVFLLVWLEVYRRNPNPGPLPRGPMLAYLVVAFLINSTLTLALEFRFMQRVRTGVIVTDLLKPLGFLPFQMAQGVGDVIVNLVFAAPIALVGLAFTGSSLLPPNLGFGLAALASVLLAFFVSFGVTYVIVQASFVLQSGYGVLMARSALHQIFSGLAAPLVMFPAGLAAVATWLPFRHIVETPSLIWLGLVSPADVPSLLLQQAAWGVSLCALGDVVFRAVMRRHQVQGG